LLIVTTIINGFRAPIGGVLLATSGRRRSRIGERIAHALIVRQPTSRAGFHFAIATMFRSKTHRLTLACAAAVGLAMALVVLSRIDLQPGQLTRSVLIIQPLLYGSLLVGFRHLVRVPAELRANWAVQLAWQDHRRAFTAGVRRAAVVALALPSVITVVPVVAIAGGLPLAIAHALLGLAGAAIVLEALLIRYDKAPFTCSYVPGSGKGVVPLLVLAFLIGATVFARIEMEILSGIRVFGNLLFLLVVFAALRTASRRQPEAPINFDEGPEGFNQLGLHT